MIVFTVKTNNPGVSSDTQLTLPFPEGSSLPYVVDWGDGTSPESGGVTHTYRSVGEYKVTISGEHPPLSFNDSGDVRKVISIERIQQESLEDSFRGANYVREILPEEEDTSEVSNFNYAFNDLYLLGEFPFLNTSNGKNFRFTWGDCRKLKVFPPLDLGNGEDFYGAWRNVFLLEEFPEVDLSQGGNFNYAWGNCVSLAAFPPLNLGGGKTYRGAWQNCKRLVLFPFGVFNNLQGEMQPHCFQGTWKDCSSLTAQSVKNILTSIDASGVLAPSSGTEITIDYDESTGVVDLASRYALAGLSQRGWETTVNETLYDTTFGSLTLVVEVEGDFTLPIPVGTYEVDWGDGTRDSESSHAYSSAGEYTVRVWGSFPSISFNNLGDIDSVKGILNLGLTGYGTFEGAFEGGNNIESFVFQEEGSDTSQVTDYERAFFSLSSLPSFPSLDTSSGENFRATWLGCESLGAFPLLSTHNGRDFSYAWWGCEGLLAFPSLDTSSGENFAGSWWGCKNLSVFPFLDTRNSFTFFSSWYGCTNLTTFPAAFFDNWVGTPVSGCFQSTWSGCYSLTSQSVENILVSLDACGVAAPGVGTEITIDYNVATGALSSATIAAISSLKSNGWTPKINGSLL